MLSRLPQRAALCLITTVAFVTAHELMHIGVGHWLGIGGHFTSLTSADADLARASAKTAGAYALMAAAGPLFTSIAATGALLAAPWARRRQFHTVASVLGWIAVFGIPYIGIQLMTLGGPGAGVDTAAVLVGHFGIVGIPRALLAVGGTVFTIAAGFWIAGALGDQQPASTEGSADRTTISTARRVLGLTFAGVSIASIAAGAALLVRAKGGNPMGAFLLADLSWAVGMLIRTPWSEPGPRFVRDVWLAPAIAAMALLTIVGALFPSDYAAAGLFFLPQLATAAYAARTKEFGEGVFAVTPERIGIATRAV